MSTLTTAFMKGLAIAASGVGVIAPFAVACAIAYCVAWFTDVRREKLRQRDIALRDELLVARNQREGFESELAAITRMLDSYGVAKTEQTLAGNPSAMSVARRVRVALEKVKP